MEDDIQVSGTHCESWTHLHLMARAARSDHITKKRDHYLWGYAVKNAGVKRCDQGIALDT